MSTSTVPRGKIEVYDRLSKQLPSGWAINEDGNDESEPSTVLSNSKLEEKFGGLTPLGGIGELLGGHKGYGLSILVEIFTGVLSDGQFGRDVYKNQHGPSEVCHLFGAINPDAFISRDDLHKQMKKLFQMIRETKTATNSEKIYIHGEKEFEKYNKQIENVEIDDKTYENLKEISRKFDIDI